MAPQQSLDGEPASPPGAVTLNGLKAIGAAGGSEPASRSDHRGDEAAVETNHHQHQPGNAPCNSAEQGMKKAAR